MIFTEGNIEFNFSDAIKFLKFDGTSHKLTYCMKAVDFIVEFQDRTYFIEVKDPQNIRIPQKRRDKIRQKFLNELISNKNKIIIELYRKYRDSFLYHYASGKYEKPISYLVLIALDCLTPPELTALTEKLKKQLPLKGPGGNEWQKPFIDDCVILNIKYWNRNISLLPIRRISS